MKTILLALSTTRQSPKTIEYALKQAQKEKAQLVVLFIVDTGLPDLIMDKMMDVGFLGDKPSIDLYQSILNEYRERGRKVTEEISREVDYLKIESSTIIAEGEFVEECLKVINEKNPEITILTRAERSSLSRLLFGSAVKTLKQKSLCPIIIVEEQ